MFSGKGAAIFIAVFFIFVVLFLVWHFYFSIYELRPEIRPAKKVTPGSNVSITYIPVNVWGYRVPFRKADVKFVLPEKSEFIIPESVTKTESGIKFKLSEKSGVLKIKSESKYFLSTNIIKLEIGE